MTDIRFILWLQQFSNPLLDSFFTYITMIGNTEYYMIAVPIFYWCINKRDAFKFIIFFLGSMYLNAVIKAMTAVARPAGDGLRILYNESTRGSSSFPSGHTQGTASFWGYMALYFKNKYFTAVSVIIIILVATSRIYLGLHFPIDVLGGLFLAFIILCLFKLVYDPIVIRLQKLNRGIRILLSMFLPLLLLLLPGDDKGMLVGFLIGLIIGSQIEVYYVNFETSAPILKQILKLSIGIIGLFGLRVVLKGFFITIGLSDLTALGSDILRYFIIGLWASYIAPLIFVKLGLSKIEKDRVKSLK